MIDEKYIELIQADVDGELPEQARAELSRYLLAHPEARALRDELGRIHEVLARVTREDPPPGLRETILAAVRFRARPPVRGQGREAAWTAAGMLRYAAVFAGGLLVGAAAWQAGVDRASVFEVSEVAGTMVAGDPVSRSAPVDSFDVALDQVGGTVSLFGSPSMRVVQFDLDFRGPADVVVAHDGEVARFSGFTGESAGRNGRYALVLDGPGSMESPVQVSFVVDGRTVQTGTLHAAAPH
ncbi:MAG TPA: hypothetical protein PK163_10975 [Steroidobacteraceae bacterium]|nr:hypothetical protein [Steroidobacteraceae bacterium]